MSKQLLAQIEAALNVGVHEGEAHGCWVPREAIEPLPDFWRLCDEGSYCPLSFSPAFGVPEGLSRANPVVVDGAFAFVMGDDGEQCFYFKLVCTLHVRHKHFSLQHAVGAFVQGELAACMRDPSLLYIEDEATGERSKVDKFDFHSFEAHLQGLLSDLVYLCTSDGNRKAVYSEDGPVVLVIAAAAPEGQDCPDELHEWQQCAQGFARIETVR